ARTVGSEGSIVRITPFSRITGPTLERYRLLYYDWPPREEAARPRRGRRPFAHVRLHRPLDHLGPARREPAAHPGRRVADLRVRRFPLVRDVVLQLAQHLLAAADAEQLGRSGRDVLRRLGWPRLPRQLERDRGDGDHGRLVC